jgi:uncharacterized protein (TIGR00661 family)
MPRIIVAPLNWGLGHASRCVPIIRFLIENKYTPILASDGNALLFLQKEFPHLEYIELPSYQISYSKNLRGHLFLQTPKILKAVRKEREVIENFVSKNKVVGIISDNRFGVRSKKVPSVYITHQLKVLSGVFTFITSKIHQMIIRKFDECWIPDVKTSHFSGKLSIFKNSQIKAKYIGVLSRFKKETSPVIYDVLIILSGIESQRSQLEKQLISVFKNYKGRVVFVLGKVEARQKKIIENKQIIYNFLLTEELQKRINQSAVIVCRSGYSSIMDLAVLHKKVFFIPTKNQSEQEYLARLLNEKREAPFSSQEEFSIKLLEKCENYKGLTSIETNLNLTLFRLFKSE